MPKKLIDAALLTRAASLPARRSIFDFMAKMPALADGRPDKSWYRIVKNAKVPDEVDILIYDEISMWGCNAAQFVTDLAEIEAKVINLRVNSPGGIVFDGLAIYQALAAHPAKIIAYVDGWAASIASVIIMAADEIKIGEAAQIMIHSPWSYVIGPADDMRKEADILDSLEAAIVDVYVARTGGNRKEIAGWVKDETWFKGQAAVDSGFADEVVPLKLKEPGKPAAKLGADFFASIFPHMPDDVRAALADGEHVEPKPFSFATATPRESEAFLRANGATRKQATAVFKQLTTAISRDESDADRAARDEQSRRDEASNLSRDETVAQLGAMTATAAIRSAAAAFPK
jgi:ATP-dependent protease ClpP protease subunit